MATYRAKCDLCKETFTASDLTECAKNLADHLFATHPAEYNNIRAKATTAYCLQKVGHYFD